MYLQNCNAILEDAHPCPFRTLQSRQIFTDVAGIKKGHGRAVRGYRFCGVQHTVIGAQCVLQQHINNSGTLELVAPEVRPPLPSLTHGYDSVHLATDTKKMHMQNRSPTAARVYLVSATGAHADSAQSALSAHSIGKPIECNPTKSCRFGGE